MTEIINGVKQGGSALSAIGDLWDPLAPPSSPHASDDEFDNASLAAAWTEWDPGNRVTVSEGDNHLKLALAVSASHSWGGIIKPRPVGDFSVYTRLTMNFKNVVCSGYLAFLEDAVDNPSTSDFIGVGFWGDAATNWYHLVSSNTAYNGSPTHLVTLQYANTEKQFSSYFRVRLVGTTAYYGFSWDGITWYELYNAPVGFTIRQVGLIANYQDGSVSGDVYFDFFRIRTTVLADDFINGRNRNIYA